MLPNLFADLPKPLPGELTHTLLTAASVRIERILSHGHASPLDFWYDQPEHEWVLLIQGAARLRIAGLGDEDQLMELRPGDHVNLPAHQRHRVEWTTPDEVTIWLAVFYADVTDPLPR